MTTWILVGDTSRAKLFSVEQAEQPWSLVEEFENPAAHKTSKELSPTPPGKMKQSGSAKSRHTALQPHTTPKQAEADRFARQIGEHLRHATEQRQLDRLVLVAPPQFLGLLESQLDKQTTKQLIATINKDLAMLDDNEIRNRITQEVFSAAR